jgi:signal transduction histidine kinase
MQNDVKQPASSLRNKIIISFFMIIVIGGILINLSFQYVLKESLTAEQLNAEMIKNISSRFISLSSGLTILGCLLVLFISILISRKITDPIKRLNEVVNRLANGRLDTRIDYTSDDEIGQLTQGFNRMAGELEHAIKTTQAQKEFIEGIVAAVPAVLIILNDRYEILSTNIGPDKSHIPIKPRDVVDILKRELFRCFKTLECQRREVTLPPVCNEGAGVSGVDEDAMTFLAEVSLIDRRKEGAIALISLTDITTRKKAEEELRKRVDELERFRKVTVKRELRMEELRRRIKDLEEELRRLRG